jgi:hypothetical protein
VGRIWGNAPAANSTQELHRNVKNIEQISDTCLGNSHTPAHCMDATPASLMDEMDLRRSRLVAQLRFDGKTAKDVADANRYVNSTAARRLFTPQRILRIYGDINRDS